MNDLDALFAAVCATPDDDLPRLVLADWLQEHDFLDWAEFIRAQCRLARTPTWEPFAVFCRHRKPEWAIGNPWRHRLPELDTRAIVWHPSRAHRRGFGWSLVVRDLRYFIDQAPRLFDQAPIGELHLPTATLDEWKQFAVGPWLSRVKSIHFYGLTTPIEPIRVLCESPGATGIEEFAFEKCSGAGMPVLIEDLLATPLGQQLRRLTLRDGSMPADLLADALCEADPSPKLERLSLITMGWNAEIARRFSASPMAERIQRLDFVNQRGLGPVIQELLSSGRLNQLVDLRLQNSELDKTGLTAIQQYSQRETLRLLDLSDSLFPLEPRQHNSGKLQVNSLRLRHAKGKLHRIFQWLENRVNWTELVELDLGGMRILTDMTQWLLNQTLPPNFVALRIGGTARKPKRLRELLQHFGKTAIYHPFPIADARDE